ncbi:MULTISPECIES: cold shock domain-containing protein [unclassified Acinetobacter]|uniref:cold shock domain-containing protein n=1 Tax=unclassified Acinetobacter TaxID=196816 RepID=UPI0015D45EE4|nr:MULTISPECIES: cold-shock protein [unclassified Acinetobacter]UUS63884.1 cold-shock protein [Acinetobacter sp. YH12068_T]
MSNLRNGTVKWFNGTKGFGFIASDTGEELFAHYSEVRIDGYKVLEEGQRVMFEITNGKKRGGPTCLNN